MSDDEIVREFLIESNENLNRLDAEIVDLERNPSTERLTSIFRTIHTIKGTCGFLGFRHLEKISHYTENILGQLRAGEVPVTSELVNLILQSVDAVRQILRNIESTGGEGDSQFPELIQPLNEASTHLQSVAVAPKGDTTASQEAFSFPIPDGQDFAPRVADTEKSVMVADSSVRVDVKLLDRLINLVGELVLTRNQILQIAGCAGDAHFNITSQRLDLITSELQESVTKARMQPIGVIWNKLPRLVRDIAHGFGKLIELEMEGADTELDKSIIEAVRDPLTHIVRNACDHGIEERSFRVLAGKPARGTLRLRAYHEGGRVNIEISDDGAGVNVERIKRKAIESGVIRSDEAATMSDREAISLLFLPGFSTAASVTSLSGRGIGMDVVKSNVESIGGTVDISTQPGRGTTIKLRIPLTLAVIPGLIIASRGQKFVIPQANLLELVRLEGQPLAQLELIHDTSVFRRRGSLLPVTHLHELLGLTGDYMPKDVQNLVVVQAEDRQFGLVVDEIHDTQEIVLKPFGNQLKSLACYSGSTILGDGAIALILDAIGLGHLAGILGRLHAMQERRTTHFKEVAAQKQRLLVFSTGAFDRIALPLDMVTRLEEMKPEAVEDCGGRKLVQYRGTILPLVQLSSLIPQPLSGVDIAEAPFNEYKSLQVVVLSFEDRALGLVVDEITDIVEEVVDIRKPTALRRGFLGSGVVGNRITDFLDLQAIVQMSGEDLLAAYTVASSVTVLLAHDCLFYRALLRSQLEMAGYRVLNANSIIEAKEQLEHQGKGLRLLLVASRLLLESAAETEALRELAAAIPVPILAISRSSADIDALRLHGVYCDDHRLRFERESLLEAVARLSGAVKTYAEPFGQISGVLAH